MVNGPGKVLIRNFRFLNFSNINMSLVKNCVKKLAVFIKANHQTFSEILVFHKFVVSW